MNLDEANRIIIKPYVTERTFALIEENARICFIAARRATKPQIREAISILYDEKAGKINTARTIYGKKAFVKFESIEKAMDLATKIGML